MTDEKLLTAYQAQKPRLYALSCRILGRRSPDVEDALQNAILKAWLKRDTIRNEACVAGWLRRIVENECVEILRQQAKSNEVLVDDFSKIRVDNPMDEQIMDKLLFAHSLQALYPPYNETIVLYYLHGFKVREIAMILQRPENTVKGLLYRARQMMRNTG